MKKKSFPRGENLYIRGQKTVPCSAGRIPLWRNRARMNNGRLSISLQETIGGFSAREADSLAERKPAELHSALAEIPRLLSAWMENGIQSLRRISALLKRAGARYLDSTDISPWSFNNDR